MVPNGSRKGPANPLSPRASDALTFQDSDQHSPQWLDPTGDLCTDQPQDPVSGVGVSPNERTPSGGLSFVLSASDVPAFGIGHPCIC